MGKTTLSLCMIVKNEENTLTKCLSSIADIVDELIIVDTGSTDSTVVTALEYGAEVYNYSWNDDFGAARNFAFDKASSDYIMWLDADEVVPLNTRLELEDLKENDFYEAAAVYLSTVMHSVDGTRLGLKFKRNRIVKRDKDYKWIGYIHEYLNVPPGISLDTELEVYHMHKGTGDPKRNLKYYEQRIERNEELSNRDLYYYAKELYYNALWKAAITRFQQFLSKDVWIEERLDALCKLAECYKYTGESELAKKTIFLSLEHEPRAELLYQLALIYKEENKLLTAKYIFESILQLEMPNTPGFLDVDAWEFNPRLQLVVCNYELNNYNTSYFNHIVTKDLKPNHPSVLFNDEFFKNNPTTNL